jgi:polyisoprenoid-binding protein YceI
VAHGGWGEPVIGAFLTVMLTQTSVGPTTYRMVPEQSDVYVQLRPAKTLLSGLSHRHVIVARTFDGTVTYGPPEDCRISVTVPVSELEVDPEEKRAELGFDKKLSEGDKRDIRRNMLKPDQLWGDRHPMIRFESDSCTDYGEGRVLVRGKMTIRGVGKQLDLPLRVRFDDQGLWAEVAFTQVHEDFGFEPYSAALGALKNDRPIRFNVRIRAERVPSAPSGAVPPSSTSSTSD